MEIERQREIERYREAEREREREREIETSQMTCLSCLNMTVGLTIIYVNRVARLVFFRPRTSNLAFLILVGLENIEVGLFVKVGSFFGLFETGWL